MNKEHKHQLASGWIQGVFTFRECIKCRQVFRTRGGSRKAEQVRSDYAYYRRMAEYYG